MDKRDYYFTKAVGRTAYEEAVRDGGGSGGGPHTHEEIWQEIANIKARLDDLEEGFPSAGFTNRFFNVRGGASNNGECDMSSAHIGSVFFNHFDADGEEFLIPEKGPWKLGDGENHEVTVEVLNVIYYGMETYDAYQIDITPTNDAGVLDAVVFSGWLD